MKKYETYDLIDINKKKGFPRTYRFSPLVRWFVILLSLAALAYAIWYIFTAVDAETSTFQKIIPFVIIFFAINPLIRNLFSLNTVRFTEDGIIFGFLLNKNLFIRWEDMIKLSLYQGKTRSVKLNYLSEGEEKEFVFTMTFPNMLEIINSIAEMCPHLQYDDFMNNITLTEEERAEGRAKEEQKG